MQGEKEFDLIDFVRLLDKKRISYLLIGRWAVILHGAPLMTADYDFWIDPAKKLDLLRMLERQKLEVPPEDQWNRPIASVYSGPDKIDLFFFKQVTNRDGQKLRFADCVKRSEAKKDEMSGFSIRIPAIDDLIALKRMPRDSVEEELKDATDIRFLKALKSDR